MSDVEQEATEQEPKTDDKEQVQTKTSPKKSHKKRNIILLIITVFILIPTFIAGWLGFVPVLSTILGATKPRDLGVRYTSTDFSTYQQKTKINFLDFANAPDNPNKPGKKTVFADPKTVDNLQLTQEELTAAVNSTGWLWMPVKNAQIRLTDNTVEVSGNLNMKYIDEFINFAGGVGYSDADVDRAISWGNKFVGNAAVYVKANASITNDVVSFSLQEVKVGRFNVPMDIAQKVLSTGSTNSVNRTENLEVKSARPINGGLDFSGTYPTTIYTKYK